MHLEGNTKQNLVGCNDFSYSIFICRAFTNADIDLALFLTAQGWSDTQASVTVERQSGLTEAQDPGERDLSVQTQYQRRFPEMFKRGSEGRLFSINTLISCDVCTPFFQSIDAAWIPGKKTDCLTAFNQLIVV